MSNSKSFQATGRRRRSSIHLFKQQLNDDSNPITQSDQGVGSNDEERSMLSDKSWIRQHLFRSYVPPRNLRSQGHIYLRGRDTKNRMALGERDLPGQKQRPKSVIGIARQKVTLKMLRRQKT